MTTAGIAHKGVPLRLGGLAKRFGAVDALRPLDLEIRSGELVAFLGPSGCGKTTTLLLIAGIYKATEGEIFFGDDRVDALHPRDRDIGMVFQSYALYPHLSLFENIAFPLRLKRTSRPDVKRRVETAAELLGISDQLGRRPGQVSGGQQQRTALARALVKEPRILLLDEPLSNLDAQIRLQARTEIRRLQQELKITTVLVTHDQSEALAMADRVAVFREGELLQYASPEELYARPADTFVARFVGHPPMNLFTGTLDDGSFRSGDLVVRVPRQWPRGVASLGIRPESIELPGDITATLLLTEPLGREFLVTCQVGDVTLQVLTTSRPETGPGNSVSLGFPTERLHPFGDDGSRIES
jgi:inositol-phosphate transport system ATP-binding protein